MSPAQLLLNCGGCEATACVPLRRRHEVVVAGAFVANGSTYDRCVVVTDDPEGVAPDGWVVWDPYTFATYCPECWAGIQTPDWQSEARP